MEEGLLQIRDHQGEGYKPLVDFVNWRVAMLLPEIQQGPPQYSSMERHLETDEVFVLTRGSGTLIIGGNGPQPQEIAAQGMVVGTIYNVREGAWHTVSLSSDAAVVIVENRDTTEQNSEYAALTAEQRLTVMELAKG